MKYFGGYGEMEEFTQYFKEDLAGDEETAYYERWEKNDLDAIALAFSSGVKRYHVFQEDKGLFQAKGQIPEDGIDGYTVDGGRPPEETVTNIVLEDGLLLTNVISWCSYPSERGTGEEIHYIVCYTRDGIFCKRAGDRCALWHMMYRNSRDYGRVMSFLRHFGSEENLRFAAHKNFWQDYLSGDMDVDGDGESLPWQENYQRWKREFVSLFEVAEGTQDG